MTEPPLHPVYHVARAIMLARDDGGCEVKDWVAEARDNPHVTQAVRQAAAAIFAYSKHCARSPMTEKPEEIYVTEDSVFNEYMSEDSEIDSQSETGFDATQMVEDIIALRQVVLEVHDLARDLNEAMMKAARLGVKTELTTQEMQVFGGVGTTLLEVACYTLLEPVDE